MNIEELIVRLRIEEDNKSSERGFNLVVAKANVVEHGQSSKINKNKYGTSGGKGPKFGPKGGISKKKFQGKCFNYDKIGHKSTECCLPKKKKEVNMVEDTSDMNFAAVKSERMVDRHRCHPTCLLRQGDV
ncbi:Retrovirus-related Pol polyprotein from transposon TNT 1-94 [Abeliophyllum distichum]|uniref:Retrovirus-related Pol polyprotein from transposon TNT 1-94 n=1 Tax=Abeliophyllum distichum TaxID=126358 RepID=A0ABD1U2X7_9LAMI